MSEGTVGSRARSPRGPPLKNEVTRLKGAPASRHTSRDRDHFTYPPYHTHSKTTNRAVHTFFSPTPMPDDPPSRPSGTQVSSRRSATR
jgi:hypothetical protein